MTDKKYHRVSLSNDDLSLLINELYNAESGDLTAEEMADIVILRRRLEAYKARES